MFSRNKCRKQKIPGFGVRLGNRFSENENENEHSELVKANKNRNRNMVTNIGG